MREKSRKEVALVKISLIKIVFGVTTQYLTLCVCITRSPSDKNTKLHYIFDLAA